MARKSIMKDAHAEGMPVAAYVKQLIDWHGNLFAAARATGYNHSTLQRWQNGEKPKNRIIALADARGMDVFPYVMEKLAEYETMSAVAAVLKVPTYIIRSVLYRGGVDPMEKNKIPQKQRQRIITYLKHGWRVCDIAKAEELDYSAVQYYARKMQKMESRKIR